jgi:hypothetical protein
VWIFHTVIPKDVPTAIAMVGLFATLIGASVALFNSWKAVCWKRAELANNYIKEFNSNDEMVFAGRCLDWEGGRLFLPEKLRAYLPDGAFLLFGVMRNRDFCYQGAHEGLRHRASFTAA